MRKLAISTLLACIFLPPSNYALAQEQTKENAQLFLQKVSEQGATSFEVNVGHGWNYMDVESSYCRYYNYDTASGIKAGNYGCSDFKSNTYRIDDYRLTSMAALSQCATLVNAPQRSSRDIDVDADGKNYRTIRFKRIPQAPFRIDWDKVAEVKQDGSLVTVSGVKPDIRFGFASEALATRVAFAMEFLRTSCDSTSGTGF